MQIRRTRIFDQWLKSLKDRRGRAQIQQRIDRLAEGNPGKHRHLPGGVSELKLSGKGPGYRVYYTQRGHELILLLCGGDKSSKAAQDRDIKRAQRMAAQL